MYEPPPVLDDVLRDIFFDNHIKPSKDWLNLPSEELTEKQFENFKRKCLQSNLPEKNRHERTITKRLIINKILILGENNHRLKNEYMELIASMGETVVEADINKTLPKMHYQRYTT